MRYLIAHLINGQVKKYHHQLVWETAKRFNLKIKPEYFPTHITLKAPFEKRDVALVKIELEKFARAHRTAPFSIHRLGHFGKSAVFLEATLPSETLRAVHGLQNVLHKKTPDTQFRDYESHKNFHITIAKGIEEKYEDIWSHLKQREVPRFDNLLFDNVALLHFADGAWTVDSFYSLAE